MGASTFYRFRQIMKQKKNVFKIFMSVKHGEPTWLDLVDVKETPDITRGLFSFQTS